MHPEVEKILAKFGDMPTTIEIAEMNRSLKKRVISKPVETSFYVNGDKMYEEILTENGPMFITLNSSNPHIVDEIDGFKPIDDNAIKEKAVLLPTGIEDYKDLKTLIDDIQSFVHKYLDIPPLFEKIASWWIVLTWVYDKMHTIPYLRPLGDTGTGKTRFEDTIGRICYKPVSISGAVTPAAVYRMIAKWKGTMIIDEGDLKDSDYGNEIIKILNCGFERGKPIIRCDKDKPDDIEIFDPFCPKIIATREKFRDKALESRCITEVMKETSRKDIPTNITKEFFREQEILRNKLLKFRFDYWSKMNSDDTINIDLGQIEPRLKQAMSSLAVLFMKDEKMMKEFKEFLVEYQKELVEERATSYDGQIINALFMLLKMDKKEITSKDVAKKLDEEYPRGEGKKWSPITIGKKLKGLGFETKVIRVEETTQRILILDPILLKKLCNRYVTDDTDVTDVTGDLCDLFKIINKHRNAIEKEKEKEETKKEGLTVTGVTNVTSVTHESEVYQFYPEKEPEPYEEILKKSSLNETDFERFHNHLREVGMIFSPVQGKWKKI